MNHGDKSDNVLASDLRAYVRVTNEILCEMGEREYFLVNINANAHDSAAGGFVLTISRLSIEKDLLE